MTVISEARLLQERREHREYHEAHPEALEDWQYRQVRERVTELMGVHAYCEWLNSDPRNAERVEEKLLELYMVEFRYGAW